MTTTIDGTSYHEKTTYDQFGRVFQVYDAAGDGSFSDQGVVHYYNARGYLQTIGDVIEVGGTPRTVYREDLTMNARGQVTSEQLGDNVVNTVRGYDETTGRLTTIDSTHSATGADVQDLTYHWDTLGNLDWRREQSGSKNLFEEFEYDGLNRLTKQTVTGRTPVDVTYDDIGNITSKTGVGSYQYGQSGAGPHAVTTAGGESYGYDANGNNDSGDGRSIDYTTFDKPSSITKGSHTTALAYGPDRSRYKRIDTETGAGDTVTLFVGNVEIIDRADGTHERKRYIGGIAIETLYFGSNTVEDYRQTHYLFKDHLGSLDVATDASGETRQEMSFDAWGQRRDATDWEALASGSLTTFDHNLTTRGFTGHEMLDEVGIVHMNGRIYDAKLGRFLQADPFIQEPTNTQSLNRYSYVLNNPLNATDPSGYFWEYLAYVAVGAILGKVGQELDIPYLSAIGNAIVCGSTGAGCAATFAFSSTLGAGGSFDQAFRSGVFAGLSSAAFTEIGEAFAGTPLEGGIAHVGAHAVTGGIMSELQGGKFGHGFLSAGLTKAINVNKLFGTKGSMREVRITAAAIVGGTISELTGGKFANGAITAAFAQAYNGESQATRAEKIREQMQLNRTDIENILERAIELRQSLKSKRQKGLLEHNHLLSLVDTRTLDAAYIAAMRDLTVVVAAAQLELASEVAGEFGYFRLSKGIGQGRMRMVSQGYSVLDTLVTLLSFAFGPEHSGPVAIPCGLAGCSVYVGDYEVNVSLAN